MRTEQVVQWKAQAALMDFSLLQSETLRLFPTELIHSYSISSWNRLLINPAATLRNHQAKFDCWLREIGYRLEDVNCDLLWVIVLVISDRSTYWQEVYVLARYLASLTLEDLCAVGKS